MSRMTVSEAQTLCLRQNIPFYSYRLPGKQEYYWGAQTVGEVNVWEHFEEWSEGFAVVPFLQSEESPALFIQANVAFQDMTTDEAIIAALGRTYRQKKMVPPADADVSWKEYEQQVKTVISALQQDIVRKLVLSRSITLPVNAYEKAADWFKALADHYPEAFVFLVSVPGKMAWMGASPEIFLRQSESGVETMALAGSRKTGTAGEWGNKEQQEQAIVTDYIAALLKENVSGNWEQKGPFSRRAGNVEHLCTAFHYSGHLSVGEADELRSVLHPTPAVGGVPVEKALEMIGQIEKRDRCYYAGYLGPVTEEGSFDWFVNLRSMELWPDTIRLHVGGGITALSDPRQEWEETELKSATLLKVIEVCG